MERQATISRKTKETDISVNINIDGQGDFEIETGIPFFNHMLESLFKHGAFHGYIKAQGDIHIDYHHTVEDVGIVLGSAMKEAIGDKRGIRRFSHSYVPMDDALVRTVVDLGGRSYFRFDFQGKTGAAGGFDIELCHHFFRSLVDQFGINLHIELISGFDIHHIIEAVFKSVALSFKDAFMVVGSDIPSTKGTL